MMWESLLKIRNLPADTQVFCGHEYTAANVHFALTIEPKNTGAARARRGGRAADRAEEADDPDHDPAGEILQSVPARGPASVAAGIGMEDADPERCSPPSARARTSSRTRFCEIETLAALGSFCQT